MNKRARVVADLSQGKILGTVEIAAPPERVFRALASEEVTKWWGSPELYQTTEWTGELKPGGKWRSSGVGADGSKFSVGGEFVELDPPRKLVQTWAPEWDGGHITTITYSLVPIEGGTRLTLWHQGFGDREQSCAGHGDGWERVLGWLGKYLNPAKTELKPYLLRLLPPRPSFMKDMSADELAIMKEHSMYWAGHLKSGTALVFGPVADPKGGWGVAVIRASGDEEVARLRDGDPAIKSGRGFSYEILPMPRVVAAE